MVGSKRRRGGFGARVLASASTDPSDDEAGDDADADAMRWEGLDAAGGDAAMPLVRDGCFVTFSTVPRSRWVNLDKLDLIAERNKPVEPPKAPESAPFFLPTLAGLKPKFTAGGESGDAESGAAAKEDGTGSPTVGEQEAKGTGGSGRPKAAWPEEDGDSDDSGEWVTKSSSSSGWAAPAGANKPAGVDESSARKAGSRMMSSMIGGQQRARSELARLLQNVQQALGHSKEEPDESSDDSGDEDEAGSMLDACMEAVGAHLTSLPPSKVDLETRSLCLDVADEEGVQLLGALLAFYEWSLRSGRRFELTQAQLRLTLQVYASTIGAVPALRDAAARMEQVQRSARDQLQALLQHNLLMISHLTSLQSV
jgi:U3 small nucleolar RNA-associated protein 21